MVELKVRTQLIQGTTKISLINLLRVLHYVDSVHDYKLTKRTDHDNGLSTIILEKKENHHDENIPCDC